MSNDLITTNNESSPLQASYQDFSTVSHMNSLGRDYTQLEIEQIRETDFERYERENLARRLVLMRQEAMGTLPPTTPLETDISHRMMMETPEGSRLVMDWERLGGFKYQLERVQKSVAEVIKDIGDHRTQRVFIERFDRALPEALRYVIYDQVAMGPPSFVVPVDNAQVEAFSTHDVGAALVREWGMDAPRLIATIWKRMDALRAALGEEFEVFSNWFNNLENPHMRRVLQFIAVGA